MTTTELPASPPTTSPPALALAAAGVTVVLWASAFVAIRHVGTEVSPGALTLGRLLVGSLVLGAVLAVRGFRRPARRDWPLLLVCGLLWFGVYNIALNAAEQRVDAGTTAMLVNVGPLLIALLAGLLLGEGFPRHLVIGQPGRLRRGRRDRRRHLRAQRRDGRRAALPRRRGRLRGRRGRPEAAARTAAGARGHLAGLHDRGGRLPAVRAAAGRGGGRRAASRRSAGSSTSARSRPRSRSPPGPTPCRTRPPAGWGRPPTWCRRSRSLLAWVLLGETPVALAFVGGALCLAGVAARPGVPGTEVRRGEDPGRTAPRSPGWPALLADPTRAGMCLALIDGRAWTAGELATATGVARSTASEHLDQLVAGGLLAEERQGRHRYLRLATPGRRAAGRVPRRPGRPRRTRPGRCAPSPPARRWPVAAPATTTSPAGSASRSWTRWPTATWSPYAGGRRPHRRRRAVAARPRRRRRAPARGAPTAGADLPGLDRAAPPPGGRGRGGPVHAADGQRLGRARRPAARCGSPSPATGRCTGCSA